VDKLNNNLHKRNYYRDTILREKETLTMEWLLCLYPCLISSRMCRFTEMVPGKWWRAPEEDPAAVWLVQAKFWGFCI